MAIRLSSVSSGSRPPTAPCPELPALIPRIWNLSDFPSPSYPLPTEPSGGTAHAHPSCDLLAMPQGSPR